MKVCIVTSTFPRSDADLEVPWLRDLVKRCREQGADVRVFAPSYRGLKSHVVDGIPVRRFRYFLAPWETLTHEEGAPNKVHKFHYKVITLLYILAGCVGLMRYHARERFDILHVHWPFPHTLFAMAARLIRPARLMLNFYGADLLLIRKYAFVKRYLRWFIGTADRTIAISTFTAGQVRQVRDVPVEVVAYGAAITSKDTGAPVSASDGPMVLSTGRMIERKGFEYLVRAMAIVRERHPHATLTIVGGGPWHARLVEQVRELGLGAVVSLPGKVSNETLVALYKQCALFALPSIVDSKGDTEGLGVVLLEAMMYRKPVVASDVGGIPDVIIDGKTGVLVPQKDPAKLASAIVALLDNPERSRTLGQAGYEHVRENFDWGVITSRLLAIYREVCEGRGA